MFRRFLLLALAAITAAQTCQRNVDYEIENIADQDFLNKQKLILDVLFHHTQPQLKKELYEVGQTFDLKANIHSFTDEDAVKYFLRHERYGLMPHDAVYSVFYYSKETSNVYKILYSAKDFDTFYKTTLYLRNRINHHMFSYAFYLAVIHRSDTQYIRLPPLYEIIPYMFYNNELLEKAHHIEFFGKEESSRNSTKTFVIPYNYSGYYLHDDHENNNECLLNYLTEDIGWNEYYFYFRNERPFFLSSEDLEQYNKYRGEEYLFGHQQIMVRYNLERHVNGLGKIEHFDYHDSFHPGFYPTMSYPNGLPFPVRPWDAAIPKNKQHDVSYAMRFESRIADAIDAGFVLRKDGEKINIYTQEGLNIIGNLIEGNSDSQNIRYYGNVDNLMRKILGYNFEPSSRYQAHPSALEQFTTSMRDPAFYRIYSKILHYYDRYNENQGPYKLNDIHFHDLEIKSVDINKLVTFFETYDSTISHGLVTSSKKDSETIFIKARQSRLNHKPFSINITVDAEKSTKASVRIFLGPKYDIHGREVDFATYAQDYFYQIDNFIYDLKAGSNTIVRDSVDYITEDSESTEEIYDRVMKALETQAEFKYQKRIYGFPNRLLLPKGKPEGMPMQLFVHIAKVKGEPIYYQSHIFGNSYIDNRSFGYPLDRPIIDHDFHAPNMYYKEISIYHEE